jgi:apolipoprotein D and lipocalin family protein
MIAGSAILMLLVAGGIVSSEPLPVTTIEQVDLERYCGIWYEIARLPNRFQQQCACSTSAEYSLLSNGTIRIVNRCRKADGSVAVAKGVARKDDPNGSGAKLKVRFAPSWLGWIPFVWGNYWIIDLASDYSYAVVGEPSRKYLWILSRTQGMDPQVYDQILDRLRTMGYETDRLIGGEHR